jgi:hypothetical protein
MNPNYECITYKRKNTQIEWKTLEGHCTLIFLEALLHLFDIFPIFILLFHYCVFLGCTSPFTMEWSSYTTTHQNFSSHLIWLP